MRRYELMLVLSPDLADDKVQGTLERTARAIAAVQGNRGLWRSTAIFVTFDESGGYYDSGYVQPVDFFGDGTRTSSVIMQNRPHQKRFIDSIHISNKKDVKVYFRVD